MIGMTPGMFIGVKCEGFGLGMSVCFNVAAAWLRWACVVEESYTLCFLSVIVNAAGAWTILSLPSQISQQRFRKEQWTLTTSIMVQANYFGWLLGAVIPPQFKTVAALKSMCLWQAILATPVLILMVVCYRRATPSDKVEGSEMRHEESVETLGEDVAGGHGLGDGSFFKLAVTCLKHPRLFWQVLACGMLGGVSFTQPSAVVEILEAFGIDNSVSVWVNVAFIGVGVISGLTIGKFCTNPKNYGYVLKALFIISSICSVLCAVLAEVGFIKPDSNVVLFVIMFLSAGIGATSLGFIGIAIEATAMYPVGAGYACWAIEIVVQALGGGLGFVCGGKSGFAKLAAVTVASTILIILSYQEPPKEGSLTQDSHGVPVSA